MGSESQIEQSLQQSLGPLKRKSPVNILQFQLGYPKG